MFDKISEFINPRKNPDLTLAEDFQQQHLPTLWLLGKTGAGKSSLVKAITGLSSIEVGNGFEPCTKTAQVYDYPKDKPIMRFLDTRGLGETGYDATADIEEVGQSGNAVIVIMKADEQEQSAVLSALKQIKNDKKIKHLLLIHSAVLVSGTADHQRQVAFNDDQVNKVWGKPFASVCVDFEGQNDVIYHHQRLIDELIKILPIIQLLVDEEDHSSVENQNFNNMKKEILWYAGSAASSDLIPLVGLVSVPTIQAKMLHSIALQYGVKWNKRTSSEFIGTLGGGFALQYSLKLGARELIKLVPVYGQTVGAVAAAVMSFGSTYGLGRVACYYCYYKNKGEPISQEIIQALYQQSFDKGRDAASYE